MLTLKQGESFAGNVVYTPAVGDPANLSSVDILSRVRTAAGLLVDTLVITKAVDNLSFTFRDSAGTENWPIERLEWDFSFDYGGSIDISLTQYINVVRSSSI